MLSSMKVGQRLTLGFGMVLLLLLLATGVAKWEMGRMAADTTRIVQVYTAELDASQSMELLVQGIQRDLRTLLMTQDVGEIQAAKTRIQDARTHYDEAGGTLANLLSSERAKAKFAEVAQYRDQSTQLNDRVLKAQEAGQHEAALALLLGEAKDANQSWLDALDDMTQIMDNQIHKAYKEADQAQRTAQMVLILLAALGLAVGAGAGFLITRSVTRPLEGFMKVMDEAAQGDLRVRARTQGQDELALLGGHLNQMLERLKQTLGEVSQAAAAVASGATELSASSEEMSTTTAQIARGGENVNQATAQVAAAVVQLTTSVQEVATNVKGSVDQAQLAVQATERSSTDGRQTSDGMERIREATTRIAKAVGVIQEIARQTNLLSLNAAIEAAKAGEQGVGFAVVAEEVRKLAERSRESAIEIEGMIRETHEVVESGRSSVQGGLEQMQQVQDSIAAIATRVGEIGGATEEQTRTAAQVTRRVEDASREVEQNAAATQQLSATVQEISRTASDLARVSEGLALSVTRFQV